MHSFLQVCAGIPERLVETFAVELAHFDPIPVQVGVWKVERMGWVWDGDGHGVQWVMLLWCCVWHGCGMVVGWLWTSRLLYALLSFKGGH